MQLVPPPCPVRTRPRPSTVIAVAGGGAIGAALRWGVGTTLTVAPGTWPWPTLIVNLIGCALIGVAAQRLERGSLRWEMIVTGLLGGFTTMSSFAVELNDLVDRGLGDRALAYGLVTLAGGAGAVALGHLAPRRAAR